MSAAAAPASASASAASTVLAAAATSSSPSPAASTDAAASALASTHLSDAAASAATDAADADADADEDDEADDDPNAPPVNPLSDSDSDDESGAPVAGQGGQDVQLGFLVDPEHPKALLRTYFPCKVGGKAAWLNPRVLPSPKQLQCVHCSNPLVFLMQLYAPLRRTHGASDRSFHRTLFLFCCLDAGCTNKQRSVVCFRSQLPLDNPFYPSEPAPALEPLDLDDDEPMPVLEDPAERDVHLCCVCGNPAPSSCAKCHVRRYCSRLHQLWDWKQGKHKAHCDSLAQIAASKGVEAAVAAAASASAAAAASSVAASSSAAAAAPTSLLFPQKELVYEPEYPSDSESESDEPAATAAARSQETPEQRQARKAARAAAKLKATFTPSEARLLAQYEKAQADEAKDGAGDAEGTAEEDAEDVESTAANWSSRKLKDPLFTKFQLRVRTNPEQVVRYDRAPGADASTFQPLWVSTWYQPASAPMPEVIAPPAGSKEAASMPRPALPPAPSSAANDASIPLCACGARRRFEFQVLPQLLYYLGANGSALDFATIAVYTCEASCGDGVQGGYTQEFAWVQQHAQ